MEQYLSCTTCNLYVAQNPTLATDADKALVKAQGGAVSLDVAECYNPIKCVFSINFR